MKTSGVKRVLGLLLVLALFSIYLRAALPKPELVVAEQRFLRVSDGGIMPFAEILNDLKAVPLVFIGELHDEPSHHWAQLEVIRGLQKSGKKVAVGVEMFRADEQNQLDRWVNGDITLSHFREVYLDNWSAPWPLYADIFFYTREEKIPIVGLNIPREIVSQVARHGFDSLTEEQLEQLPPLSCDVDDVYKDFIRRALSVPHKEGIDFENFCEAQLVWDTAMAWNLLEFLRENPEHTVVVLAGSGHSWKRAIPEQIRRRSDLGFRVILPEMPRLERTNVILDDTDYLWLDLPLQNQL
jgi:uncharacterized iron-regulated protein